jgi:SnoaL-like domain
MTVEEETSMQPPRLAKLLSLLFPFLLLPSQPALAQSGEAEKAVVRVVERLFQALKADDTAGMRAVLHPAARIVQTGTREGTPFNRVNSVDDFLISVGAAKGKGLEERIYNPEVRIDDNLATVWLQYDFLVGGQLSHCGVDSYQIVRGSEGWRILQIVDTQRREGCPKRN